MSMLGLSKKPGFHILGGQHAIGIFGAEGQVKDSPRKIHLAVVLEEEGRDKMILRRR